MVFYGNKTISASFVQAAKSDFTYLAKAGGIIQTGLKTTSVIFGWVGATTSTISFISNPTKKGFADVVMSGVAFVPVVGWALSGSYFIIDQTVGWEKVMKVMEGAKEYNESARKEGCWWCALPH